MSPRTPDEFPGVGYDDGICLYDQYGNVPDCYGGIVYSDGYFYGKDQYGIFNLRNSESIYPSPHINSHLGNGNDSLYILSTNPPTINEDISDGYEIGLRWVNTVDGYEYVLVDNTLGAAVWRNTTGVANITNHAYTHIYSGDDAIDGDKLDIDFIPSNYIPEIVTETDSINELTSHLAGIDGYLGNLDAYFITENEHKALKHLIHFLDDGPGDSFPSGCYKEITPVGGPWPLFEIWYDSFGVNKKKIIELNIIRDSQKKPISEVWKIYDNDGVTILATVTDSIIYQGPFEISRTRTFL